MGDKLLTEEDLPDVLEELHGTESKWKTIGVHLKLPVSYLKEIETDHRGDHEECSLEMQIAWLRSKKATWKSLVEVLTKSSVGFEEKAATIESKKLSSGTNGNMNFSDYVRGCRHSIASLFRGKSYTILKY